MPYTPVLKASAEIANIPVYDDVVINWELMGAKEIKVDFEVQAPINLQVGGQIMHKGEPFTINTVPSLTKDGENSYKYKAVFESVLYRLYDKKLRHLNNRTFQEFGNPAKYAKLIVDNINEIDAGWTVGVCDDLDPKHISFSGHTCRTALDTIAEAFGLEWDVKIKVIRFTKQVGVTTTHVFKYGMGNGLYSLSYAYQNDKNIVTRAYGYGSPRNLPEDYRGGAKQLMFAEGYLESNVSLYGVKEGDYENEDIYPEVAGVVSGAPAWTEGAGTFKIKDDSIIFDLNNFKSVETPKLSFTTGGLQGQNFDILGFDFPTKTYTLKVFQDGNNLSLPNSVFQAAPGDTYTLFDMPLPSVLVTEAEIRLKNATLEWLNTNSKPQVLYSLELDPLYARANNIMLEPGDRVTIQDTALGINELIRVTKVQYPINFPEVITPSTKIIVEIANFVPYTLTERVLSDIKDTKQEVKTTISQANYIKRMAEYVKTLSGVDYLPPNTLIIDPATGTITANLINADYIIARNLITGKVKITALNNNIVFEDDDGNAIMMIDDTGAIVGERSSTSPPSVSPEGITDPDYLYSQVVQYPGGASELRYFYNLRAAGMRWGLSPKNSDGYSDASPKGFYTNGTFKAGLGSNNITMGKDGFNANGERSVSGHIKLEDQLNTYKVVIVKNGLIVGYNPILPYQQYQPLSIDPINPLPNNSSNDTGYQPVSSTPGNGGGGVGEPVDPPTTTPTTLMQAGTKLGLVVRKEFLDRPFEVERVQQEAMEITSENELKTSRTFPSEGVTNFIVPDQLVNWAEANGKEFHGHTLWWIGKEPVHMLDYVRDPNTTVQQAKDLLKYMIQTPVLRYKGRIKRWDVINEPVKPGSLAWNESAFIEKIGVVALKLAFVWAHEADPDADLLANEFDWEYGGNKMNFLHTFISECIAEGIPLHGIGLQLHRNVANVNESGIRTQLTRLANTGLKVRISEIGLKLRYSPYITNNDDATFILTQEMQQAQGAKMVIVLNAWETLIPDAQKITFVMWGVFDYNYKNNNGEKEYAMLWDDSRNRKAAYTMALAEKIRLNNL